MIATTVLIVGGGPAGAACAWQLQQHNIHCLLLDKADFPRSKPCAGWVTPEVFSYLGITPNDYPHSLTIFTSFQISLRGLKFRLPTRQFAIRRLEFDAWLLARSGAQVYPHRVEHIKEQDGAYVIDNQFSTQYLIGAGGTHCPVRRALFSADDQKRTGSLILTKEEEFAYPYHDERCHLWFFEDGLPGYGWYVPKQGGYLNVGIGGRAARLQVKGQTLNEHWCRLIEKLDQEGLVTGHDFQPQGYSYYLRARASQPRLGNACLVGDSLGLATRDMGEGIGPAIRSGILAAKTIIYNHPFQLSLIPRFSLPSIVGLSVSSKINFP